MTDIYVVSGFLGAGKTTLIQSMVRSVFKDKKIVVIENDFGDAGIDAGILRECSLTVKSLSAGCICCSLTGDFEKALEQSVKDYKPEVIIVEPSGVGKLSDIVKACFRQEDEGRLHLKRAITVVDVRFFDKYWKNYGEFFEDQIAYADLILLSHQEQGAKEVKHTQERIREINPEARIEEGFWDSIPPAVFRYGPRNSELVKLDITRDFAMKPVRIHTGTDRGLERSVSKSDGKDGGRIGFFRRRFAKEVFSSVTLDWDEPMSEADLRKRVLCVVKHANGSILRGKGIVACEGHGLVFHFTPESLSIEPVGAPGNQVCFIGAGLDGDQIKALFREGKA